MSDNSWDYNNQDNSGSLWSSLSSTCDAFNFGQAVASWQRHVDKACALYEGVTVVLAALPRDGRIVLLERDAEDDRRLLARLKHHGAQDPRKQKP